MVPSPQEVRPSFSRKLIVLDLSHSTNGTKALFHSESSRWLDIDLSLLPRWSNSIPLPWKIPRVNLYFKAKDTQVTLGSTSQVKLDYITACNTESASTGEMEFPVKGAAEVSMFAGSILKGLGSHAKSTTFLSCSIVSILNILVQEPRCGRNGVLPNVTHCCIWASVD